jgi:protein ImuB
MARMLVLWCPDWPVTAAGYPPSVPAAVFHANRVVACSAAARAEGVRAHQRRREAQGRCPELITLEEDPGREARAFEPVIAAVEVFTPCVEIRRPGVVAFATRGPSRYFGGDEALAARILAAADLAGATGCRAGVADGTFAGELAARSAGRRINVISAGETPGFLAPLPVSTLDAPELADLLVRLGIRTLGQLAALPADAVLARFGTTGATAQRLARGLDERPPAARIPPPDLTVTAELDPPIEQVETAAFVGKALADELHQRLGRLGLACSRIGIEAETEHGEHLLRLWRHDGALTAGAIAERIRWQLEGWWSSGAPTAGLTLLRLVPDEVKADHGSQLGLWGGSAAADERAARAFARIQGLLGPGGVVTAVRGGGRDPADQVRMVPWGDPREPCRPDAAATDAPPGPGRSPQVRRTAGPAAGEAPPWPGRAPPPSPAVVHRRLVPAEVLDGGGRPVTVTARGEVSGPPASVATSGGRADVVAWTGPWPLEERWWDPGGWRRRARFQVCLADGSAKMLALESRRWWIEASYD